MGDQVYINNYLKLKLSYHKYKEYVILSFHSQTIESYPFFIKTNYFLFRNQFRVVGFTAEAKSVDFSQLSIEGDNCNIPSQVSPQFVNPKGTKLLFLYSVEWQESPVSWASRWDIYLGMSDVEIHWFSIINSLIVVFLLSG